MKNLRGDQNNKKDEDHLGDLEKKLYQKDSNLTYKRQVLEKQEVETPKREWEEATLQKEIMKKKLFKASFLKRFLLFSVTFFMVMAGLSFYFIWIKPRITSPQNIDILVKAPASVQGGEEILFQIIITNNNTVALEASELRVQFPEGVLLGGKRLEGDRYTNTLGTLLPGQEETVNFELTFFGEENTERDLNITLEYRAEGSNATFSKEKEHTVVLATSPVSLLVDIPEEVNAGESFTITIDTVSNTNSIVEDFLVVVEYPFGFTFSSASVEPSFGENIWFLGDLSPNARKKIIITGKIEGQPNEERTFKVSTGIQNPDNTRLIEVLYNSYAQIVPIKQPFIAVDFALNGIKGQKIVVDSGKTVTGEIIWKNNTDSRVLNGELRVVFDGEVLNESSVKADRGFYSSTDNTILWNQNTDRALQVIDPGEQGTMRFTFDTVSLFGQQGSDFVNPQIKLSLIFSGERVSPGFPSEAIRITQSKDVNISSAFQLNSFARYSVGPFANTGPIPPQVEKETTYTITWTIVNSSNRISDAQVRSSTPLYVTWKNVISPANESVLFNNTTGELVWNIDSILPGTQKEVSFQVGFLPSISQVGTIPTILFQADLQGLDTFTGQQLFDQEQAIDTSLEGNDDPLFVGGGNFSHVTQ